VPVTVCRTIADFRASLDGVRERDRRVGLVPTMGSLHAGHASLVERSAAERDVTAVSVFVNPLQFGAGEDLAAYPRDLDRDVRLAEAAGASLVFAPSVEEMYPTGEPLTTVTVAQVSEPLEGRFRPTHFAGVATVVAKLFAIAGPVAAYFGEKDYQQLVVVRRLVGDLSLPVEVVGGPTVREPDGLAMSSRNVYLTPEERAVAPLLYRTLVKGKSCIEDKGERDPAAVNELLREEVAAEPRFTLDYAEVVNASDLTSPTRLVGAVRLLVAARLGKARLIDNLAADACEAAQ
jgi:pantoate--beta-alanine ligase